MDEILWILHRSGVTAVAYTDHLVKLMSGSYEWENGGKLWAWYESIQKGADAVDQNKGILNPPLGVKGPKIAIFLQWSVSLKKLKLNWRLNTNWLESSEDLCSLLRQKGVLSAEMGFPVEDSSSYNHSRCLVHSNERVYCVMSDFENEIQ